jgi:hypothetical protein
MCAKAALGATYQFFHLNIFVVCPNCRAWLRNQKNTELERPSAGRWPRRRATLKSSAGSSRPPSQMADREVRRQR